ncbi:hypothetical protein [Mucilaginibacter sp. PAMB04168]|uniref:hypothetical protein n=1 Tax=Mucilaginibacter sp. PAMB04168 TaxID=3138567 RepID=UPI0031F6DC82
MPQNIEFEQFSEKILIKNCKKDLIDVRFRDQGCKNCEIMRRAIPIAEVMTYPGEQGVD